MLSIIIPTINEEKNIGITIEKLNKIFTKKNLEIIIVDDKSTDNTINEINKYQDKLNIKIISNKNPKGLGYALLQGFNVASKEYKMFLDADLSIDENDITKLFDKKKYNGMVIGSRYLSDSNIINASKVKVLLSKILNLFISKYFNLPITDLSHSFRIIHKNVNLNSLNYTHPGFFWEITVNANLQGYKISEESITFIERKYGISKNKTIRMLYSVIKSIKNLKKIEKK